MNGPSNTVKMGLEPGFQLILIVSAMMHILAIIFISDQFMAKEKIEDSYFVKLVMPAKINQPPKVALKKKAAKKAKPLVTVKPVKKAKPLVTVKPVKKAKPLVTVKPVKKTKPLVAVKPEKKAKPLVAVKPVKKAKPLVTVKPVKKPKPVKKQIKARSPETSIKRIEKKRINKSYVAKKQSLKSMLPLVKSRSESEKKYSIKRKIQNTKADYNRTNFSMDRTDRGSKFLAKADVTKQGEVIAEKGISGKTEFKSVAKGLREQSFASIAGENNEQHMIERNSRVFEKENGPVEKAFRDSQFANSGFAASSQREEIDETQHEISRADMEANNGTFPEYPEEDTVEYPEADFSGNPNMAAITGNEDLPAISRPAALANSFGKKVSHNDEKEQLVKEIIPDDEKRENNKTSPELSIQGVPLDDLNACANALDERMLKKKILNIVGNKKGCYSQDVGEYLFMGTARFASFDMKILPGAGRKLSNRCEELRNAFHCLTLK